MNKSRLILFAHGSRDPRWRKPFEKLSSTVAAELGRECVRLAYLEMFRPTLLDIAAEAARDGFLHLRVLPLFLSAGAHVAEDLPTQVAEAQTMYPQLHIEVVPPVGEHPSVVSAIEAIAREALR